MKKISTIAVICLILDQGIKWMVTSLLPLMEELSIIPNFFSLMHIRNYGAAWSMLDGNRAFLILMSFFCLCLIYYFFIYQQKLSKREGWGYGLLIGGILGNLIDRMFLGYVIDYLKFNLFGYEYPIFNFADCCIVISTILILYDIWRGRKTNESIHSKRNRSKLKN